MASKRVQILQALEALVGDTDEPGYPAGLNVHRSRYRPIDSDKLPAIVLYSTEPTTGIAETIEHRSMPHMLDRFLRLRAEVRVKIADAGSATPVEDACDPYYLWAVARIVGAANVGGLLLRNPSEVRVTYDVDEADAVYGGCAVDFDLHYETTTDPET